MTHMTATVAILICKYHKILTMLSHDKKGGDSIEARLLVGNYVQFVFTIESQVVHTEYAVAFF